MLLLFCWSCEAVLFIALCWNDDNAITPEASTTYELPPPADVREGTGACHIRRWDARNGYRPIFCVGWRNMRAENGQLGIFKTPLHKTITVERLAMKCYRYSHAENGEDVWTLPAGMADRAVRVDACAVVGRGAAAAGEVGTSATAGALPTAAQAKPVYRFWSPVLSRYFYTLDEAERRSVIDDFSAVWTCEGVAFHAYPPGKQPEGTSPVYRFWSGPLARHFYTASDQERDRLISRFSDIWTYEGIAWYAERGVPPADMDRLATGGAPESATDTMDDPVLAGDQEGMSEFIQVVRGLQGQFEGRLAQVKVEGPLREANLATKVIIRDLDYCLFRDNRLQLGVQCRNAVVSTSDMEVVLRGGVTICAEDGGRLMSSCVVWDVQKNRFSVPGRYVLDRDGTPVPGRGLCCDHRLGASIAHEVYGRKGEHQWIGDRAF
ncbi:MAG: hypothetical protein ABFE13_07265 [Phycisphaerales bacterium]